MKRIESRAAGGSAVGLLSTVLSLAQAIVQVPLLLSYWSVDVFGLWAGVNAAVVLLIATDFGHQAFLGNSFCRLWVEDRKKLQTEVASGVRVAVALAVLEFACGLALVCSGRLSWLVPNSGSLPSSSSVTGAFLLYMGFWVLNGSVGGILVRLYLPAGYFIRGQWLGIGMRLSGFLAIIGSVMAGASIFGAMAAQVVALTVLNGLVFMDLRRRMPEVYPWWRGGNWATAWHNFRTSLVLTANGIAEQLAGNGLVLLVGRMLSPGAVALFTTVRTVANAALQGTGVLLNPVVPDMVRYHIQGAGAKLGTVFAANWLLSNTLIAAGLAVGVLVLEPVYTLWTRGRMPLDRSLFAALGLAVAIRQWAAPCQTYLASINRLRPQSTMAVARAALGLGTAGVLLPWLGLPAAGLGVLAAEVGAAVVAVRAARAELLRFGTAFPSRSARLALAQLGLAAVVLGAFAARVPGLGGWSGAALVGVCVLGWQQWCGLSDDMRTRLRSLAEPLRRRFQHRFSS